jgi:Immunity protein 35
MHSREDAERTLYATVLRCDERAPPEDRPALLTEHTQERPWGWVFFYNNERYRQTRDFRDQWVGPGPIFFNRETGEVRQFGSGCNLADELYDYEMELAAGGGRWCLWLTEGQDRSQAVVRLKALLALTMQQAAALVPAVPTRLFWGVRRHLDWLATHLREHGVAYDIRLEQGGVTDARRFVLPDRMTNPSPAQAYHERLDV